MENFLPALFIIGAAIYKIYTEYQKEQEKARKRKPTATAVPNTPPARHATQPAKPIEKYKAPTQESFKESRPAPAPTARVVQKPVPKSTKKESKSQEVENKVENHGHPVFNLREAIIQEAVLNRPYQ